MEVITSKPSYQQKGQSSPQSGQIVKLIECDNETEMLRAGKMGLLALPNTDYISVPSQQLLHLLLRPHQGQPTQDMKTEEEANAFKLILKCWVPPGASSSSGDDLHSTSWQPA